ncbi:hypothetical protein [Candidatus Manganitrophus noduliformans]|uniref:Uncharacterized protein n=1 Tax=Candidatus Manganitrophus noduliformans TaxID=2606439 RepID=A0A7X6I9U6_9BACT|nr:hypothetical protein [Candidatus Manganitrophus noduliformans]NKE69863.1 hypothetical protein [Candidatus Manganitrophus noduliformans]
MTLKFGDPESIAERDRGRKEAILKTLRCPNPLCATRKKQELLADAQYADHIDWVCGLCGEEFETDIEGKVTWSENGWEEDAE